VIWCPIPPAQAGQPHQRAADAKIIAGVRRALEALLTMGCVPDGAQGAIASRINHLVNAHEPWSQGTAGSLARQALEAIAAAGVLNNVMNEPVGGRAAVADGGGGGSGGRRHRRRRRHRDRDRDGREKEAGDGDGDGGQSDSASASGSQRRRRRHRRKRRRRHRSRSDSDRGSDRGSGGSKDDRADS
jgi:hypothetical protein